MKKSISLFLFAIALTPIIKGQILETEPGIPTKGQPVTIYFNSDKLEPTAGLYKYTSDLYAHTGVTIEGVGRWQNVIESWGNNTTQPKFEYLGNYRYKLEITPDIENFYPDSGGDPIGDDQIVTEICLVVRNAASTLQTSPDYFIDVFEAGLEVNITNPAERSVIVELNELINISASASFADSLTLFIDGKRIVKGATAEQLSYTQLAYSYGGKWVRVVAYRMPETAVDSFYYFVPGLPPVEEIPAGAEDGINYISDDEVILVVTAPGKSRAFVTGDFNGWIKNDDSYMNVTPDGQKFWKRLQGLTPGLEYRFQYLIDEIAIADPYTEIVLDPWNDQYIGPETYPDLADYPEGLGDGIVGILQTAAPEYQWKTTGYTRPGKRDLVIYELLLRDFLAAHNYNTLIDTLGYLDSLGINAIELMPVNEFDGNESWGYNPSFYFAPDKYYGTKNKLKEFVDSCHARGIAVILDVVLNHATGSSPMAKLYWDPAQNNVTAENPWFNVVPTHPYNVFHDFNHESLLTQYHAKRVMAHWIEEYRVDGYRFDLSKGFTQTNTLGNVEAWGNYDASRVAIWKMYADHIWSIDPDFWVILEHFADNSEEIVLADYGMMLWGNINNNYALAAMGWSSDISWASYLQRGWTNPNLVSYMESHDEERIMYRLLNEGNSIISPYYNTRDILTSLERVKMAGAFFFTLPGPKMIWQFEELGYDFSINYIDRTAPKPIRWNYFTEPPRKRVYNNFSSLINLRKNYPVFTSGDFTITQSAGGGLQKRINITHSSMDVVVIGNFDVVSASMAGEFTKTGYWYEFFSGDSINVTMPSQVINMGPGIYKIYTSEKVTRPPFIVSVENPSEFMRDMLVYPNPFTDRVTISLGEEGLKGGTLDIMDYTGRKVKTEIIPEGTPTYIWDGRSQAGTELVPGIYFIRITSGLKYAYRKVVKK